MAAQMEILAALNIYADREDPEVIIEIQPKPDDEDKPEPWQDPDATGWQP